MGAQNLTKISNKPLIIIVLVFFISFVSFLAILTWDQSDSIAIFFTYLMSFGFACIINLLVLKKINLTLAKTQDYSHLLSNVVKLGGEVTYLVDESLNCINLSLYNDLDWTKSILKLRTLLNNLNINQLEIIQIENFTKGFNKIFDGERLIKKADTLYVLGVNYNAQNSNLIIKPFDQEGFTYCLKIIQNPIFDTSFLYEHLSIGYFEEDKNGFITKANLRFVNSLGYKLVEFFKAPVKFNDLTINDVNSKTELTPNNITDYQQKFVSLKTKQNEVNTYLLIRISKESHYEPDIKTTGLLIRLRQKEINYFTQNLEKHWIDYSWKCFFEKSPYPVLIISKDGSILKANNAFNIHVPNKKIGFNFTNLFIEKDAKFITEKIDLIINGIEEAQIIPMLNMKDSSKILDVFIGKILNLDGGFDTFIIRVTDVTQQKHLEDNLSHAQRMQTIGQLVGSVAHDFNNILTAISGFCDLLLLRHGMGDPSFSNIMQIKQSADRASNLVKRLLAFSRKQTLQLQIVNPINLFSEFTPLIQRLIGTRIKFSQYIDPGVWYIKVDIVQMEQVILNLVVNAQQAMGNEGILIINVENLNLDSNVKLRGLIAPVGEKKPPSGEYVMISVEDSGCGISKENIKKIFEPFYTTKLHSSGTGLGLSTVYGVVRQSNAYIYVKSKIDKGSRFVIIFPKVSAKEFSTHETEQKFVEPLVNKDYLNFDVSGSGTIILVEDEDAIRMFAKNVLVNKGYKVIDFSSAKEAFHIIKKDKISFDLLITDVLMPEMSGPNLVTKLQEINPQLKVIFISGYAEEAFTEEYGEKRDFNFLAKPFSLKQLLIKVKEVINYNPSDQL